MTTTLCQCGEELYQTDDGLMCKSGHPEGWKPKLARSNNFHELVTDTEKPSTGQVNGSTVLSGVSPGKGATEIIAEPGKASMPWGLVMSQDHRYWFNGEGPVPSVTTVLEILSKPALVYWKGQEVARAIYRNSKGFFGEQWEHGEDAAIGWAMKKADEQRDRAAKLGSSIHLLADMVSRGAETAVDGFKPSEQEIPYLEAWRAFTAFLEAQGASIVSSEHAVWGSGYAGTYDLILQMESGLWLVDIKTSKGLYPEYGLQLAAYGHRDNLIILPNDPKGYPMPRIDRYAVLHLRPDQYPEHGYKLIEYPVTDEDYYRFISALDLYLWRQEGRFEKTRLLATST